jgi:CobQ/CobB/MinD/ParA nucleotide binding domain
MNMPPLIFVTGKGGAGKSIVAASLALALSRRYSVTLADLDRRLCAAGLLGVGMDAAAGPVRVHKNLEAVALSTRAELEAFIRRIVPLRVVSRRMLRSRTFGYVTAAVPGLEAFLVLDRLRIMTGDHSGAARRLVVDAPASGSALEMLAVARGVREIAPIGTLNRLARQLESFLTDPTRFGVIIAVKPEEMALHEAAETASMLANQLGIRCLGAVLTGTSRPLFSAAELRTLGPLGAHAALAFRRDAMAADSVRARASLKAAGLRVIELPMLFRAEIKMAELRQLAGRLQAGLLAR